MLNLIIGVIVIALGVLGMRSNWWFFLDLFKALISLGLVGFGIVALLAGIRSLKSQEVTE